MRASDFGAYGRVRRRAGLRLAALLLLVMLFWPGGASADADTSILTRVGFERLESVSEALGGPDALDIARRALSGELALDGDMPRRLCDRFRKALKDGFLKALTLLAAPVLAALTLRLTTGREDGALALLCRLACACGLAGHFTGAAMLAERSMADAVKLVNAVAPVLAAAMTLSGAGAVGTALTPLSALCAGFIENALSAVGLPLCAVAAVVAACGSLSRTVRLDRLFALLCRACVWGVRLSLAAFVALLAVEGRLAAVQDTASSQAVGRALRSLIPYIGPSVSDSAGALAQSAVAARGAVGVTGLAIALWVCARPAARLAIHALSLRLAAAIIEPVADRGVVRVVAGFGEVSRLLLALCVGSAMLTALLCGVCLGLAGAG